VNIVKYQYLYFLLLIFSFNGFANQGSTIAVVEPALMNQIQSDYIGAINGSVIPKIGDTMNWAKGTLTRTGANQLRYVNNNNGHYEVELTPTTDLTQLAKENSDIRNTWIAQYGVNLASLEDQSIIQESYKTQISHVLTYGLGDNWTKEKPWNFGFGIGAYKESGKIILYNQDGPISYNDLLKTNEYKALTGSNIIHEKVAGNEAAKEPVKRSVANLDPKIENADYIKGVKDSSIEMLITASAKYKSGIISKDQYIQIALQVSQTAEYYNKNKKQAEVDSSKKTSLVSQGSSK
jgi:hypothetical protein